MPECPGALQFAHMRDGDMMRLRFPGGELTASQLDYLSVLSQQNGNRQIDLTHRANLQIRGLHDLSQDQLASNLKNAKILAHTIEADRIRNILADPLRGKTADGLIPTCTIIKQFDDLLQNTSELRSLSPKFSFIIDNGGKFQVARQMHDLALIAVPFSSGIKFRLSIAQTNTDLYITPHLAAEFLIQITVMMHQTYPNHKRMAHLLNDLGLEALTLQIEQINPACERLAKTPIQNQSTLQPTPPTPPIGTVPQTKSGHVTLGLGVPVARLSAQQCKCLAQWAKSYGSGTLRLSPWQIIYLTDVKLENIRELSSLAQAQGFIAHQNFLDYQVYACSGGSGCPRTKALCKEDGLALMRQLQNFQSTRDSTAPTGSLKNPVKIHLSGCERGCGYAGKTDILALAQTDGTGYSIYHNKSLSDIRNRPEESPPAVTSNKGQSNIVQTIMACLQTNLTIK